MRWVVVLVALALVGSSCSSAESTPDNDAGSADAGDCGGQLCSAGQYCVRPCCGGAPPLCDPLPDGGSCPAGTTPGTCDIGGLPGCQHGPCTPPPPYCSATIPTGCSLSGDGQVVCVCA